MKLYTAADVERELGTVEWKGSKGIASCPLPGHEDSTPSFAVWVDDSQGWDCKGCVRHGKLSQLALELGWGEPSGNGKMKANGKKPEQWPYWEHPDLLKYRHKYPDAEGRIVLEVHRYEGDEVPGGKVTVPWNPATGRYGLPAGVIPVYNLPSIIAAQDAGKLVAVAEGEKKSDAVSAWGLPCSTSQGGASSWKKHAKEYAASFRKDSTVIVFEDSDDAGREYREDVCKSLAAAGAKPYTVDLGFEPDSGNDIHDWINKHTREEFAELVKRATPWKPSRKAKKEEPELQLTPNGALLATRDLGHAQVLAQLLRNRYRWAEHRGSWMEWTSQVWKTISEARMVTLSTEALRGHYGELIKQTVGDKDEMKRLAALATETCIYSRMIGALSFLRGTDGFYTEAAQWDADGWTMNVINGELDLHSGELRDHDPTHLHSFIAGAEYLPDAQAEKWEAHLARFLPNANIRRQVQRDLGVALVGGTLHERLSIWYGGGGNGKTTTERIVQKVFGDYARSAAPNLLVASKYERHSTEIADLASSRIVFSVEIGSEKRLDLAQVKLLTGGEVKKARYMRCDFFEFAQTFSVFMLVNHKPRVADNDRGTWRRLVLVPWKEEIPEAEKRDQDEVVRELTGPAVLSWIVAGLMDWQKDRTWTAPEVDEATTEYRNQENRFAGFLSDRCQLGPNWWTATSEIRSAYEQWCQKAEEDPAGQRALLNALGEAGCEPKSGAHNTKGWKGIRMKPGPGTPEKAENREKVTVGDGTAVSPYEQNESTAIMEEASPTVTQGSKGDSGDGTSALQPDLTPPEIMMLMERILHGEGTLPDYPVERIVASIKHLIAGPEKVQNEPAEERPGLLPNLDEEDPNAIF